VRDLPAQAGQGVSELEHLVELLLVASLAPAPVVQILLASGGVDARGLQVTLGVGADPHLPPGRGNGQRADALDHLGIRDASPRLVAEAETAAPAAAAQAGTGAVRTAQARQRRSGSG